MATNKASRLQSGCAMLSWKRISVGILAAVLLAGCGVGVDDPEGQAAAGLTPRYGESAAGLGRTDGAVDTASAQTKQTPATTGQIDPTTNPAVLPQDPVPMLPEKEPRGPAGIRLPDMPETSGTDPGGEK
jgi:hypothetical protein